MDRVELSVRMFLGGCACSQAILGAWCESGGLHAGQAMKLAAGFAAGMCIAETCGAVSGSIMVMGVYGTCT